MQIPIISTSLHLRCLRLCQRGRLHGIHLRRRIEVSTLCFPFTRTIPPIRFIRHSLHEVACSKHRENKRTDPTRHAVDFRHHSFWQDAHTWRQASVKHVTLSVRLFDWRLWYALSVCFILSVAADVCCHACGDDGWASARALSWKR